VHHGQLSEFAATRRAACSRNSDVGGALGNDFLDFGLSDGVALDGCGGLNTRERRRNGVAARPGNAAASMNTIIGQTWFWPARTVVVVLPVALLVRNEVHGFLARRDSANALPVSLLRNWVLPACAV